MPYPGFDKSKRGGQDDPSAKLQTEQIDTVGKTETFWTANVKLLTFILCMVVMIAGMVAFGLYLHRDTPQPENLMTEEQMQFILAKGDNMTWQDFEPYDRAVMMEDVVNIYRFDVQGGNFYFMVSVEGERLYSVYLTDMDAWEEIEVLAPKDTQQQKR